MDPAILFVSFKSASKIRLVHWPALLETRSSACQLHTPLARRWRAACKRLANYTHPWFWQKIVLLKSFCLSFYDVALWKSYKVGSLRQFRFCFN